MLDRIRNALRWSEEHRIAWEGWRDPVEGGVSRYQSECEAALPECLRVKGVVLSNRRVDIVAGLGQGRPEVMITGEISKLSARVWIYTNQVDIMTPTSELRLEEWGAKTPADHIEEVIQFLRQLPLIDDTT